jgi:hypothetical protein
MLCFIALNDERLPPAIWNLILFVYYFFDRLIVLLYHILLRKFRRTILFLNFILPQNRSRTLSLGLSLSPSM